MKRRSAEVTVRFEIPVPKENLGHGNVIEISKTAIGILIKAAITSYKDPMLGSLKARNFRAEVVIKNRVEY